MNPFAQLQEEIAAVIAADPLFAEVEVLWEERGDAVHEAQRRIEQQLGCVNILTPNADTTLPNLVGPYYDNVRIEIECLDFPAARLGEDNGAPSARDMACRIAAILQHYTPQTSGQVMSAAQPTIARGETDLPGGVVDLVRFNAPGLGSDEIPRLVLTADVSGDPIELTCATPGAAIFYTTDGKNPAPRNGTLYAGAFARPAAGTRLKARAWLAGYLPSNVVNELLT